MRTLKQLALLLLLGVPLWSQTTAVTATLTDSDGQTWNNGSFSILFIPTPGTPGPFTWTGGITFPQKFTGTMNSVGVLSVSLPDNNFIAPKGSKWQFTLCSNTSAPCVNVVTPVSGASIDLSSLLSNNIVAPRFGPTESAYGYADIEVITSLLLPGSSYFNVTSLLTRQWTGGAWVNVGGGVAGNPANPVGSIQGNNAGAFGGIPNTSANFSTGAISTTAPFSTSGTDTFTGPVVTGRSARAITGATSTDTIATSDCGLRRISYQTSVPVAVTLPTATTLGVSGCWLTISNDTSTQTVVTITPATWTFTYQGQTGLSAIYLPYHIWCTISPDAAASTWDLDCSDPDILITAPFTTGTTTPSVDATAQFNATINAKCPLAASGSGCKIRLPANGHFFFHPATGQGTQFAVSIQRNGVWLECAGGTGPQYSNSESASSCTMETDVPELWLIGIGELGASQPIAGPYVKDIAFRDISPNRQAAGAIIVSDTNGVRLDNITLNNGFHEGPTFGQGTGPGGIANQPPAATCAVSAGGSLTQPTTFTFTYAMWSTSGPTVWAPASAGCVTSAGNQTITISGLPTIGGLGGFVNGYELAAKRTSDSNYCTMSAFSYTTNADGSVTFNTPVNATGVTFSGTTATYTADTNLCTPNFKRGPSTFGAPTGGVSPTQDLSRSLGILAQGSSNWNGNTGNTNELKNTGEHCFNCETAFANGPAAAASEVLNIEFGSCDFNSATGVCQSGATATLGAIVGLGGLRMLHGHYSGAGAAQGCSSGVVALLTGFVNTITDSIFETSCTGNGVPINLVSAKDNKINYTCEFFSNTGQGDANSIRNEINFNDNTTCVTVIPVFANGNNQYHRVGGDFSLGSSGTVRTGVSTNTDMAGTLAAVANSVSYTFLNTTYTLHPICQASDETTVTSAVKVTYTAATSVTFTTPGATDVIDYTCIPRN